MSTRYYGKKMSRSLSSSAVFLDVKMDTAYMTVREGSKVYRVPVMVIHDPERQIQDAGKIQKSAIYMEPEGEIARAHVSPKCYGPNLDSTDGNWTLRSQGLSKEEAAKKRSLQLRNNAVSQLFEPPEHLRKQGASKGTEVKRSTTPDPYMARQEVRTVYTKHAYPVGATLPRTRLREGGDVVHVKNIYTQHQLQGKSISVPVGFERPPSPSSTIRDFEMSEESAPSIPHSPVNVSADMHLRSAYYNQHHHQHSPVGPLKTSTPPSSTRVYVKKIVGSQDVSASRSRSRIALPNDDEIDGRRKAGSSARVLSDTSQDNPQVVYRGEVVRVQVPSYKGVEKRKKSAVPDEYYTYRQMHRSSENLNVASTSRHTTQTSATVHIEDSGVPQKTVPFRGLDNEQHNTDVNANEVEVHHEVRKSSSSGSRSRSVSESSSADENMYSVAFEQEI